MSQQVKKNSLMLYVKSKDPFCDLLKMVLAEKGVPTDIIDIDLQNISSEDLAELSYFGEVPILSNKEAVVYQSDIIFEYLEERFPYPPLMSVFPQERASMRLLMKDLNENILTPLKMLINNELDQKEADDIKKLVLDTIIEFIPTLSKQSYIFGKDFSILDCCMAIIFYHLTRLGIKLPQDSHVIFSYAKKLFSRDSFRMSLKM